MLCKKYIVKASVVGALLMPGIAAAVPLSSTNFRLDPDVANTFGGRTSSANYVLQDSGGEGVIGTKGSTSYRLAEGYVAQLAQAIELTLSAGSVTIPAVTPGISQTGTINTLVRTDAPSYTLGIHQDNDLTHTDASTTIAAISSSIGSTDLWSEGTTKGLGFTITGGTDIESSWGSNPNYKYAAIPGSVTTFHTHSGFLGGATDTTSLQYRLDVPSTQKSGTYSNTVTYSATMQP